MSSFTAKKNVRAAVTPRWIWLLSGGVVLAMGVLIYGWSRTLDKPAPTPVSPAPTKQEPKAAAPQPTSDIKLASIEEKKPAFYRPEPTRRDFKVAIELVGSSKDEGELPRLKEDAELSLEITPAEDAFISLWTLSPDGSATQIYPLAGKEPTLVKAGEKRTLPEDLVFKANFLGDAPERIWVLAASHAWSLPASAKANNILIEFATPAAPDAFEKEIRGEILKSLKKESSAHVAEHIFQYVVVKK